ncbi:MAG: hypothetical protein NZU63_14145, partial [Gemmataceae bacterium]|nr:hypothetical protein [Gemmataceae bacterium]
MYQENRLNAEELSYWALLLLSLDCYISPDSCIKDESSEEVDTNNTDYYEPMWYVLQQLSTSEIDGPITH